MKKIAAFILSLILSGQFTILFAALPPKNKPKNIILMVGDGTGLVHLYAAYTANGGKLDIYSFAKVIGLSITASADDYITDSAAGATAFSTGKKTKNGMLALGPDTSKLETISELAKKNGKSTGVVVTCELTHATPAAFYAHQPNRNMYPQIANDMSHNVADVMIGGGFPFFDSNLLVKNGFTVSVGTDAMLRNQGARQVCFFNHDSVPAKWSQGRGDVLKMGSVHAIDLL